MWSVWLVFCDSGFHSVSHLMDKDKRLMKASWSERLTVESGSCSDGQGQFSVDGWGCEPSLSWSQVKQQGGNSIKSIIFSWKHCLLKTKKKRFFQIFTKDLQSTILASNCWIILHCDSFAPLELFPIILFGFTYFIFWVNKDQVSSKLMMRQEEREQDTITVTMTQPLRMQQNWLEPMWPKMAEDSNSKSTWALLYFYCNALAC